MTQPPDPFYGDTPSSPAQQAEGGARDVTAQPDAEPTWGADARAAGWTPQPGQQSAASSPADAAAATADPAPATPPAAAVAGPPSGVQTGTLDPQGARPAASVPSGATPDQHPLLNDEGAYVTRSGDSLPLVAELFGHPGEWKQIYRENFDAIADPNVIYPGQGLTIPAAWLDQPNDDAASPTERSA